MYDLIKKHPNPREVYTQQLINNGESDATDLAKEMEKRFWDDLQQRLDELKQKPVPYQLQSPEQAWLDLRRATPKDFESSPATAISKEDVEKLFRAIMNTPEGYKPLRKIQKLLDEKVKLFEEQGLVDWATGELLAYASLLADGY